MEKEILLGSDKTKDYSVKLYGYFKDGICYITREEINKLTP